MKLSEIQGEPQQDQQKPLKLSQVSGGDSGFDLPSWLREVVAPPKGVQPGGVLPFGTTENGKVARYQEPHLGGLVPEGTPKLVLPEWIASPVRGAAAGMEAVQGKGPVTQENALPGEQGDIAALAGVVGGIRSPAARAGAVEPIGARGPAVENVEAEPLGPKAPKPAPTVLRQGPTIEGELAGQEKPVSPPAAPTPNVPAKLSQVQGKVGPVNPPEKFVPPEGWWKKPRPVAEQTGQAPSLAKRVGQAISEVLDPETAPPLAKSAMRNIRSNIGQANRDTAATSAALSESRNVVAPHVDEFKGYVDAMRGEPQIMPPTKPALLRMINHIEGGADEVPEDLQPVAQALKDAYGQRRAKLEATKSTENMSFVEDYFTHLWKNQDRAQNLFASRGGKQGSGLNLKNRYIPTLEEGLAAGLEPVSYDPVEMTMAYVTNMDRYIANNRIVDRGRASGDIKYYQAGSQPEGWVPLNGRLAQKTITYPTRAGQPRARNLQAYAPADFARVYNNFISKGFYDVSQTAGDAYTALQGVANSFTLMELGLSAYHAGTMAMGAVASGLGKQIGKGLRGEIVPGIQKGDWVRPFEEGRKFQQQYLRVADHGPDFRKIADLGAKVNVRVAPREQFYRASAMGSFFDAWRRGTLRAEMARSLQNVKERPLTGPALELFRNVGRVVDQVSAPIFDHMIPQIKSQVFYEEMRDWLVSNPKATEAEQVTQATKVWDSVDNRFGEMVQDNIFWNKMTKQVAQIVFRSPTWNLGIIRLLYGGSRDIGKAAAGAVRGKKIDLPPNAQYILGAVAAYGLANGVATYLKTGKAPNDWKDLFSYQTGGTNPDGSPERALMPGHSGEIMGYIKDPVQETLNKVSTFLKLFAYEVPFNKDFRGLPIHEQGPTSDNPGVLGYLEDMIGHVVSSFVPISVKNITQGAKTGTGLNAAERGFGVRTVPSWFSNPERAEQIENRRNRVLNKAKRKSDRKIESQRE